MPTVTVNHVLYHRYETQWSQRFQLGAGLTVGGYSTGGVGLIGYIALSTGAACWKPAPT